MKKILVMLLTMLTVGCGDQTPIVEKPPLVRTAAVESVAASSDGVYSGTVQGRYSTNLAFQVGGRIVSRAVDAGARVSVGSILMSLDASDFAQQVNQAEAQIASTAAQLELAHANLARYRQLYSEDAIAAATLDQYQTSYDAARAAYDNAVAAARQADNALSYTRLVSDADGVISEVNAEEGQVVAAGQTVLTLVQTDELEVEINVPENKLPTVGQSATIKFWASTLETRGVVREIAPMADAASRTYRVRIALPEPPSEIRLGMTASASFDGSARNEVGVIVPLTAIYQSGEAPQVWVVEGEKVKARAIEVKRFEENRALIEGVRRGEVIVTAGVNKLRDGQSVRLK